MVDTNEETRMENLIKYEEKVSCYNYLYNNIDNSYGVKVQEIKPNISYYIYCLYQEDTSSCSLTNHKDWVIAATRDTGAEFFTKVPLKIIKAITKPDINYSPILRIKYTERLNGKRTYKDFIIEEDYQNNEDNIGLTEEDKKFVEFFVNKYKFSKKLEIDKKFKDFVKEHINPTKTLLESYTEMQAEKQLKDDINRLNYMLNNYANLSKLDLDRFIKTCINNNSNILDYFTEEQRESIAKIQAEALIEEELEKQRKEEERKIQLEREEERKRKIKLEIEKEIQLEEELEETMEKEETQVEEPVEKQIEIQTEEPIEEETQAEIQLEMQTETQAEEAINKSFIELDFSFNKDQAFISSPVNAFTTSKASNQTLLYSIAKEFNKCDTAFTDYTKDATNGFLMEPLSKRFCDNIIIYYYLPENIKDNPVVAKWMDKQKQNKEEKESTKLLEILSAYLPEHTASLCRVLNSLNIEVNKGLVKPTRACVKDKRVVQMLKVSLPDNPLDNVLKLISDNKCKEILESNNFYINDIDITQDFAGCINKKKVIEFLLEQDDFRLEGDDNYKDEDELKYLYLLRNTSPDNKTDNEESKSFMCKTILDNDNKVGSNCLTFITHDKNATVRYKFYNKFIQSLESPSVRGNVGSHIADWVCNPEKVLKDSIRKSLDTGLLRLEITFYLKEPILSKEYLMEHMDYLQKLLPKNLIYHQPISKQWELYCSNITSNLCVVNTDNKTALLSFAINSLTSKINGRYIDNTTTNKLSSILKLFTFNVPLIILLFARNGDELAFQYNTYNKNLTDNNKTLKYIPTYLWSSNKVFSAKKKEDDITPQDMGLINFPNIHLDYAPKLQVSLEKTNKIPIEFTSTYNKVLEFPQESKRKRLNTKAELDETLKLIALHKEELEAIKTNNKEIQKVKSKEFSKLQEKIQKEKEKEMQKLENICNISKVRHNLIKYLNTPTGNVKTLFNATGKLYIYGIKYIKTQYQDRLVLATNTTWENNIEKFTLYWGTPKCKEFIDKFKDVWGFTKPNYIISHTNKPLAIFNVIGVHYNRTGNECVDIECYQVIKETINNINEEKQQEEDIKQELEQIVKREEEAKENSSLLIRKEKLTSTLSIEDVVKEGDKLFVIAYSPFHKSNIIECKINGGKKQVVKSNRFLDDILKNTNNKFTVMVGICKTHPIARRKCRSFINV